MRFNLFFMSDEKFGHKVTFTHHLAQCLRNLGHPVGIYTIMKRPSDVTSELQGGVCRHGITPQEAIALGSSTDSHSIVTALDNSRHFVKVVRAMRSALIVAHRSEDFGAACSATRKGDRIIISAAGLALPAQQADRIPVSIPLPYHNPPTSPRTGFRSIYAIHLGCISNLSAMGMIARVNEQVLAGHKVSIYGEGPDSVLRRLDKNHKGWRKHFKGPYRHDMTAARKLAEKARFLIQAEPAEGRQVTYEMLDAFASRAVVMCHSSFLSLKLRHNKEVIGFKDLAELKLKLTSHGTSTMGIQNQGIKILKQHKSSAVIPQYLSIMNQLRTARTAT